LSEEGRTLLKELGNTWGVAYSLNLSGRIALSEGDSTTARSLAEEGLALFRELGIQAGIASSLSLIAQVEAHQGNYTAARSLYEEILTQARETDDRRGIASYLEEMAEVVVAQREGIWAARLWGAAETLRTTIGMPLPPVFRVDYERAVAAARNQVGEKAFAAAWVEGRSMTLEQVLAAPGRAALTTPASAGHPSTPTAKTRTTYPVGLTAREVEVLLLVAQGLTDAQVAEQLVISPRTVNTHLTSIYNKLGVDSRAAATRFAVEHLLL